MIIDNFAILDKNFPCQYLWLTYKNLQPDWSRIWPYWLHCTLDLNIVLFDKKGYILFPR